jgi:hypothetical protein
MLFRYLDGLLHSQTVQGLLRSSGGRGQKNKEQAAARSIFLTTPWDDRQAGPPENPGGGERAQISLMTEDRNEVYTGRRGGGSLTTTAADDEESSGQERETRWRRSHFLGIGPASPSQVHIWIAL